MTSARRQSSWMVTLSLAAIAVVYVMCVWMPGHRAIKQMQQQLQTRHSFVAQANNLSATLVAAEQELMKAEAVSGRWERAAPKKKEISGLYGRIDAMAKDAQLAIGRFDPQPFVALEKLQQIPITMNCSGKFGRIHQFLRGIEALPATVWVESIRIEKGQVAGKDTQCELNLVVFSVNPRNSDYANMAD